MAIKLTNIVIVGASGHGKVVADALVSHPKNGLDYTVVGFVDDDAAKAGQVLEGRPVLGAVSELDRLKQEREDLAVIVAIGDNNTRRRVYEDLRSRGFAFFSAVHRSAVVAETVRLGEGVLVAAGTVVNTDTVVGDNSILNTGCTIDHDCGIGAHVHVAPGANVCGTVTVGEGAMVGVGASVIPNLTVGENALIAAGAAVTKDVPPGARVGGVPATQL